MGMRSAFLLLVTVALLTGLEGLAYLKGGSFSWIAARVWALMGFGFLVLGVREIARSAADGVRERDVVSLVMVLLVGFAALWGIGGVDHVQLQHEATQEVAWGLEASEAPSWRYTKNGHLGYPCRQYLIVAVPSMVLGRGLFSLRLGFALVFFFGVLLFWSGARTAWGDRPRGRGAAAVAALCVVAFPFAVKHLHWYEQTTLPLAFTLAAAGWLMVALRRPSVVNWIGLAWIGALLGTSYTPALGSWCLLIVCLVWLAACAWRSGDRGGTVSRLAVTALVAGFGALSFLTRMDLFKPPGQTIRPDLVGSLGEAYAVFFLGSPAIFIPAVLILPILIPLALGLVGRLGVPGLAISWWVVGIVAASVGLAGNAVRAPAFDIHRAQIVIPPLLLLAGWSILRLKACGSSSRAARVGFVVVCLLIVGQAVWTVTASYRSYRPDPHEFVFLELLDRAAQCGVTGEDPIAFVLFTQMSELKNSGDFLRYFFPRHTTVTTVEEAAALGRDTDLIFLVADPGIDRSQLPEWIDPASLTTISSVESHNLHELVIWAGLPPSH